MRTYGRVTDEFGNKTWQVVETDENGFNDYVYMTAFVQSLQLNLNESPFYARFGLPARRAVQTQIAPDSCVAFMQTYYSRFFASLIVTKQNNGLYANPDDPVYNVFAVRNNGSSFEKEVAL